MVLMILVVLIAVLPSLSFAAECNIKADVVLLIDGSASITHRGKRLASEKNYYIDKVYPLLQNIIGQFTIGKDQVHIGFLFFGEKNLNQVLAREDWSYGLDKSYDKNEIQQWFDDKARSKKFPMFSSTYTNEGVTTANYMFAKSSRNRDARTVRVLFLLTDGESDAGLRTNSVVESFKRNNWPIVTFGIGKKISKKTLKKWATKPEFAIQAPFPDILKKFREIGEKMCKALKESQAALPEELDTAPPDPLPEESATSPPDTLPEESATSPPDPLPEESATSPPDPLPEESATAPPDPLPEESEKPEAPPEAPVVAPPDPLPESLPGAAVGEPDPLSLPGPAVGEPDPLSLPGPAVGEPDPLSLPGPAVGEPDPIITKLPSKARPWLPPVARPKLPLSSPPKLSMAPPDPLPPTTSKLPSVARPKLPLSSPPKLSMAPPDPLPPTTSKLPSVARPKLPLLPPPKLSMAPPDPLPEAPPEELTEVHEECNVKADVVLLIDGSGSITGRGRKKTGEKDFYIKRVYPVLQKIIDEFTVSEDRVHVGFLFFGPKNLDKLLDRQDWSHGLDKSYDKNKIQSWFDKKAQSKKFPMFPSTYTNEGVELAKKMFEKSSRFKDAKVAKVLLLLTDGESDAEKKADEAVEDFKKNVGSIVTVGIGGGISKETLEKWATKPEFAMQSGFSNLAQKIRMIEGNMCKASKEAKESG